MPCPLFGNLHTSGVHYRPDNVIFFIQTELISDKHDEEHIVTSVQSYAWSWLSFPLVYAGFHATGVLQGAE